MTTKRESNMSLDQVEKTLQMLQKKARELQVLKVKKQKQEREMLVRQIGEFVIGLLADDTVKKLQVALEVKDPNAVTILITGLAKKRPEDKEEK